MIPKILIPAIIIITSELSLHSNVVATTVNTPLGLYEGSIMTTRLGKTIYAFRGIRYAEPPVKNLRFKPPVAVQRHEGVYDATKDGPVCPQPSSSPISEDCLLLNVYSTTLPKEDIKVKKPVIVFLHAGGWYSGTGRSDVEGPEYLLDKDVVLVTVNYRLATLGFLSLGAREAPGNNGLKDQVEALRWVKRNILAFGGDPNLVTLAGYSCGSASVSLHLISPMSRGLFHRAIMGSGSSLGNWPITHDQFGLAQKQARILGCKSYATTKEIMECFSNATAQQFADSLEEFAEFNYDPIVIWEPAIEKDFGQERFLTEHPIKSVLSGNFMKIPMMSGITTKEFGYEAIELLLKPEFVNKLNNEWEKYAPIAFIYERDSKFSKQVSKGLRDAYFGDKQIGNDTEANLAQLYNDGVIGFGVNRGVELFSKKNTNPVYYYEFAFRGRYSHYYYPWSNDTLQFGVVHHDELIYLFYISVLFPKFTAKDPETKMVEKWTSVWAHFAKTGKPFPGDSRKDNILWQPYTELRKNYLEVGEKFQMKEGLYEKWYQVWRKLFPLQHYLN